jgi:hypothetical protein
LAPRDISHNLQSSPGCVIIKRTDSTGNWWVWHRSIANKNIYLDATDAADSGANPMISGVSSTTFTLATNQNATMNASGATYVAYLFAHDAGGFPVSGGGSTNGISCGSYTGNGSATGPVVTLGYEPQYVLIKQTSASGQGWGIYDIMRGIPTGSDDARLTANTSNSEVVNLDALDLNATGFQLKTSDGAVKASSATYIYIAIRRGPMKTPTVGTSVFTPYEVPASPTTGAITGFVTDAGFIGQRAGSDKFYWGARLMGDPTLNSTSTAAESANANQIWDRMNGWWNSAINGYMTWGFARAPGFMDVVCYTGTGSATTQTHNLGVVPEMMIVKRRDTAGYNWNVYLSTLGASSGLWLNDTTGELTGVAYWNSTSPTSSVFSIGSNVQVNASGGTYVAYLFATVAGVSKVGTYTGTGTTQTINCGFTGGSRFVMIKRTDSTGDWYVWDSARGIIAGNDPYLLLNSTAAEVTGTDYVDTANSGFEISSTAPAAINASAGTFIFLAIA